MADKARRAAVAALVRTHQGAWASQAIDSALASSALSGRDRAFAAALFFGTLERRATLDFLLAPRLARPVEKLDVEVRAILESGLYQMLWMRVPNSAAVNEAVKLARSFGKSSAAGFVNAVLRKSLSAIHRAGDAQRPAGVDFSQFGFGDEAVRVQVTWSVSPAVAAAVMQALPGDYDAFFEASFSTGEVCLRTNTLKTTPAALEDALKKAGAVVRGGQVPGSLYARLAVPVAEDPLFQQGAYHVQGEASQLACACVNAKPGMNVLDVCAAPGGKSATLAQQMGGGAGLTACELHQHRLPLIAETFQRLGITGAAMLQQDATQPNETLAGQHAVLCDVPCSGLGVLATKPDLRTADGTGFLALPAIQMKCLATASRYVSKGGRLVYSTCTVRPQENEDVVRAFLAAAPGFALLPPPFVPNGALLRDDMMTLLPHRTGMDGFFVATMERMW
ncbi:MAG: 16S rRNA (cytosine(967)-C(5))-methyltransferase RsmB [Oscillospiraceae bacterium]